MCVDRLKQASESFPIVKRKDEGEYGEYPTKLLMVQAYRGRFGNIDATK